MKNGKINMIILILIIVVTLILGLGIGIYVGTNLNKNKLDETKRDKTERLGETIINTPENTTIKNEQIVEDDEIKYDGSQEININGKQYVISYNSDFYEYDDTYPVVVNLYFNNKKLRSINMPIQHGDFENGEEINREYKVKLYNISNEYILAVISNKSKQYELENAELCVINLNGEYIGSRDWGNMGVYLKENGKHLGRYEVHKDGFLIFGQFSPEQYVDMKYTISNNKIEGKQERFYSINEVERAGK